MKVLLSIKPEFADRILNGDKHFEFRKAVFKNADVKTVVIYATKPVGKVIGEFDIAEVLEGTPNKLWKVTREYAGISKAFFEEYFEGRDTAYAIRVQRPTRYSRPLDLTELLPRGVAPQSFQYLPA